MTAGALSRLTNALSIVLPSPLETSLLQACLWSGEPARRAWASHRERAGDLRRMLARDRRGVKKLAPLLLGSVTRSGLEADDTLLTVLRTAHLRASLRSRTVLGIARDVLRTLATDGVPHAVLDGLALAETVYGDPALRHCAAVELLVRAADLPRAVRRVSELSTTLSSADDPASTDLRILRHASGLPLVLRSRLVLQRDHALSAEGLLAASRAARVAEVAAQVLSPADGLLDACLRGFFDSGRAGLVWVPDPWRVLHGSADLDWSVLLERAREGNLALPLLVVLGYLAERLEAPIPLPVLDHLRDAASRDPVRGEKALSVAVAPSAARVLALRGGWGSALTIVKWALLPSPAYVRAIYQPSRTWHLPFYYFLRHLRIARRGLGALRRRVSPVGIRPRP